MSIFSPTEEKAGIQQLVKLYGQDAVAVTQLDEFGHIIASPEQSGTTGTQAMQVGEKQQCAGEGETEYTLSSWTVPGETIVQVNILTPEQAFRVVLKLQQNIL